MKAFKIILTIFIVLFFLAAISLYVFLKTFDIGKYQSRITARLSAQLNRDVSIDELKLDISFDKGTVLNIGGLSISDDPQFSKEKFLIIDHVNLKVDIMSLLRERQVRVLDITVQSPDITLIRNREGRFNTESMASSNDNKTPANNNSDSSFGKPAAPSLSLPDFVISALDIKQGTLHYIDRLQDPGMAVDFSEITLKIDNFSPKDTSLFVLKGVVWGAQQNIKGNIAVDIPKKTLYLTDNNLSVDISRINLKKMAQSFSLVQQVAPIKNVTGTLYLVADKLTINDQGLVDISAKGELTKGTLTLENLPVVINHIQGSFKIDKSDLTIDEISCNVGEGKAQMQLAVDDYLGQKEFSYTTRLDAINLEEVLDQAKQPAKLYGKLYANITGKGSAADTNSLSGKGSLEIKEGTIKDMNVLKIVFSKISMVPNLVEKFEQNLPEKYKEKLKSKDTDLNKLKLDFSLSNGQLAIDPAQIEGDGFSLLGKGTLDFAQTLFLQSSISVPRDLSLSMVEVSQQLQYLLNEKEEIFIPLKAYQGPLAAFKPFPDLEYLGRKFFEQKGREELKKVLDKNFGKKEPAAATDETNTAETPPAEPQTEKKNPERELIDNILDTIFKK